MKEENMPKKLGTSELKNLITKWLETAEGAPTREDLSHYVEYDTFVHDWTARTAREMTPEELAEERDEVAKSWGLASWTTDEALRDRVWDLWRDGKNWKRVAKHKVGSDWIEYFADIDYDKCTASDPWPPAPEKCKMGEFPIDVCGEHDDVLTKRAFEEPLWGQSCIYREFVSSNDHIADNYRLEVITTPDDDAVVGWWITVD
jgi:hypothetical protein